MDDLLAEVTDAASEVLALVEQEIDAAIPLLQEAIRLDSAFATAYAELAKAHLARFDLMRE